MVTAPAFWASARVATAGPFRVTKKLEKSIPPIRRPIGGMITSLTSELTMLPKAVPITTPTAPSPVQIA